jgi:hypothetical protein
MNVLNKLTLSSFLFFGTLMVLSCSKNLYPEGRYQDKPVAVDGNISDWGLPLRFSNPEYSMQYAVTNDDKNIYVCVYSRDESFQMRMLRAGMSICFDPKGEKNKNISLIFPVKKPSEPPPGRNGNPIRTSDARTNEEQLIIQSDYYNTIGMQNMENGQYNITDQKSNIKVAVRLNEDSSLVYEAAIPVRYILGSDLNSGYTAHNFSVGIVVNGTQYPSRNPGNGYRPYSSYGGMRGMHGMGRNNSSNNNTASKPEENWYQFRLVYKKP